MDRGMTLVQERLAGRCEAMTDRLPRASEALNPPMSLQSARQGAKGLIGLERQLRQSMP